ncbi:hypothetical protein PAMP_016365 [Pampus punctatissimus]
MLRDCVCVCVCVCVSSGNALKQRRINQLLPLTHRCTLIEPGPRTHLTLLIPHLATCSCF